MRKGRSEKRLLHHFVLQFMKRFPVTLPEGPHPFPSRTRKLSPPGPMILQLRGCGKVGSCRVHCRAHRSNGRWAFLYKTSSESDRHDLVKKRNHPTSKATDLLIFKTNISSEWTKQGMRDMNHGNLTMKVIAFF